MEHEFDWDLLIDCIDDGRVMPVLGRSFCKATLEASGNRYSDCWWSGWPKSSSSMSS